MMMGDSFGYSYVTPKFSIVLRQWLTQQMVSRIETVNNPPTLRNFIKYVDSVGLEIKIEKKNAKMEYSALSQAME